MTDVFDAQTPNAPSIQNKSAQVFDPHATKAAPAPEVRKADPRGTPLNALDGTTSLVKKRNVVGAYHSPDGNICVYVDTPDIHYANDPAAKRDAYDYRVNLGLHNAGIEVMGVELLQGQFPPTQLQLNQDERGYRAMFRLNVMR